MTGSTGGTSGGTSGTPSDTENCGSQTETTEHQLVDILLVLDRSGSMLYSIAEDCYCDQATATAGGLGGRVCANTAGCTNRWVSVSAGIQAATSATPFLQWGLKFFSTPNEGSCVVSKDVEVPIPGPPSTITQRIADTTPARNTPTAAAITAATTYLKGLSDTNPKVILLATDGEPNCAAGKSESTKDIDGTKKAIEAAFQAGFKTYVIGIGPSTGNLDDFADAGHTGKHFPALTPQNLQDALNAISTAVVSCTFTLANVPENMESIAVYVNKNLVPQDETDGWKLGPDGKSIELTGPTCDKVRSELTSTVQVLFGCKDPPIILQ